MAKKTKQKTSETRLDLRLPNELLDKLKQSAKEKDMTVSALLRSLAYRYLASNEKQKRT